MHVLIWNLPQGPAKSAFTTTLSVIYCETHALTTSVSATHAQVYISAQVSVSLSLTVSVSISRM